MFPRWQVLLTSKWGIFCSSTKRRLEIRIWMCNGDKVKRWAKLVNQPSPGSPCVSIPLGVISAVCGSRTWYGICIFTSSIFFLLSVLLPKQAISGRNMTSSPSHQSTSPCSQHNPKMHSVSCYCTRAQILFRNCSNTSQTHYYKGCRSASAAGAGRKCWAVMLRK